MWKILPIIIFTLPNCAKNNENKNPLPPKKSDPFIVTPVRDTSNETLIDFHSFGEHRQYLKSCRRRVDFVQRSRLKITVDGEFFDWPQDISTYEDPEGDVVGVSDLSSISVMVGDEVTSFRVTTDRMMQESESLYVALYSVNMAGDLVFNLENIIKIGHSGAKIQSRGEWIELPSPFIYESAISDRGIEFNFSSQNFLSGMMRSEFWAFKIMLKGEEGLDYSSLIFIRGDGMSDHEELSLLGCNPDNYSNLPIQYQEISRGSLDNVIDMVRFIEEKVGSVLNGRWLPISSIPVMAIEEEIKFNIDDRFRKGEVPYQIFENDIIYAHGIKDSFGLMGKKDYKYDPFPEVDGVAKIVNKFFKVFVGGAASTMDQSLKEIVISSLSSPLIKEILGKEHWLNYVIRSESRYKRLGILLGSIVESSQILDAMEDSDGDPLDLFRALRTTSTSDVEDLNNIENIYFNSVKKSEESYGEFNALFKDEDNDGLPYFLEKQLETSDEKLDTDGDSWSDLAEYVGGSSPTSSASVLSYLYPDGSFQDVIELIPKKVRFDKKERLRICPDGSDINRYAILVDEDKLMISVDHENLRVPLKWEVDITNPGTDSSARVRVVSGSREFDILDKDGNIRFRYSLPMRQGVNGIDITLFSKHIGISELDTLSKVRVSVYSHDNANILCDDTKWISPTLRI